MTKLTDTEVEVLHKKPKPLKNSRKKRIGYGAVSAVLVTLFSYVASQFIAAIFIGFWAGATDKDVNQVFGNLESSTGLQFVFFILVEAITVYILWSFLKSRNNSWKDIGMARKPNIKDVGPALITFAVYFVFLIVVTAIISKLIPSLDTQQSQELGFKDAKTGLELAMVFASLVILPPLAEEITVRGFLYTGLKTKFAKNTAAIIASALFGIAHLQLGNGNTPVWIAAIDTFILSMFLIHLRERTGAIWSGMLVHGMKNGLAFLFLFVVHIPGI